MHKTLIVSIKSWSTTDRAFMFHMCIPYDKQKRSTEGCSKFKSPETRQVQERLVSTLEHMQVPKGDRTRCPEKYASSVGMPHLFHMFYGNLAQLGKKPNSVIRSRSVTIERPFYGYQHFWHIDLDLDSFLLQRWPWLLYEELQIKFDLFDRQLNALQRYASNTSVKH